MARRGTSTTIVDDVPGVITPLNANGTIERPRPAMDDYMPSAVSKKGQSKTMVDSTPAVPTRYDALGRPINIDDSYQPGQFILKNRRTVEPDITPTTEYEGETEKNNKLRSSLGAISDLINSGQAVVDQTDPGNRVGYFGVDEADNYGKTEPYSTFNLSTAKPFALDSQGNPLSEVNDKVYTPVHLNTVIGVIRQGKTMMAKINELNRRYQAAKENVQSSTKGKDNQYCQMSLITVAKKLDALNQANNRIIDGAYAAQRIVQALKSGRVPVSEDALVQMVADGVIPREDVALVGSAAKLIDASKGAIMLAGSTIDKVNRECEQIHNRDWMNDLDNGSIL